MPFVAVIALVNLVSAMIRARGRKAKQSKPKSLCVDCSFAHIQYGATARRATSCTYNGGVRPVSLDVLYCTDYRVRETTVETRTPIGFVRLESWTPELAEAVCRDRS